MAKTWNTVFTSVAVLLMLVSAVPVMACLPASDGGTAQAIPLSDAAVDGSIIGYGSGQGIEVLYREEADSGYLKINVDPFPGLAKIRIGDRTEKVHVTWSNLASEIKIAKIPVANYSFALVSDTLGDIYSCNLNINVPAKSLTLQSTGSVAEKESCKLEWSVSPPNSVYKRIVWASSDDSIATVDNDGTVHGVKTGSATITATMERADGTKTDATCSLTVTPAVIHVTSVELDKSSARIGIYQCVPLKATVKPDDAADKSVVWTSSNDKVAIVYGIGSDVTVYGVSEGNATITVRTVDGNFTATCEITVVNNIIPIKADGGKITSAQEENILSEAKKLRNKYPDVMPVVKVNSDVNFVECSTSLLKHATVKELDATFLFSLSNKSSIMLSADAIKSIDLSGAAFRVTSEKQTPTEKKIMAVYDICIEVDGKAVTSKLSGDVRVNLPYVLPQGQELKNLNVVCMETKEEFEFEYAEGEGITFSTDHFSHYAIVYETSEPTPSGGLPLWAIVLIIVAVIAVIAAIVFVLHKKGKI